MATTHALTVVKNNCYKAPRVSNTNLPASMKEIKEQDAFSQNSHDSEDNFDHSKIEKNRTSTDRRHINKSRNNKIQRYEKADGVSEEQFYENLMKLREEHKRTLKLLETRYYNELEKQNSFQWNGFEKGVGLQEYNCMNSSLTDMKAPSVKPSHDSQGTHQARPKSPPQDFIRDLSHLTNGSTGNMELEGPFRSSQQACFAVVFMPRYPVTVSVSQVHVYSIRTSIVRSVKKVKRKMVEVELQN